MNTILQQRIKEAAKKLIAEYVESFRYENGMGLEPPIKIFFEKIGTIFFEQGVTFALQNQWISVKDALPPCIEGKNRSEFCLCREQCDEYVTHVIQAYNYELERWNFSHSFVTHWMEIPKLKGSVQ